MSGITFNANTVDLADIAIEATGTVSFKQRTDGISIGVSTGAGDVTAQSISDLTINTAIDNNGEGGDIYLAVGDQFINNAGVNGIDAGNGRFLVYVDNISDLQAGA